MEFYFIWTLQWQYSMCFLITSWLSLLFSLFCTHSTAVTCSSLLCLKSQAWSFLRANALAIFSSVISPPDISMDNSIPSFISLLKFHLLGEEYPWYPPSLFCPWYSEPFLSWSLLLFFHRTFHLLLYLIFYLLIIFIMNYLSLPIGM